MITAETIERIANFDSGGLPIVSLYVRVGADKSARRAFKSQVTSLLHQVRPLTEDDSLGHAAKVSLRQDIEKIEAAAKSDGWRPGTRVVFTCSGAGLDEHLSLPRAVRDRVLVDTTPWVRPMLAVLDEYHRACVVVMDSQSARVFELYQEEMVELEQFGAESERRLAEAIEREFRERGCELLAFGGHEDEVNHFIHSLPRMLQERVAGTFTIDLHAGADEVRKHADAIVERYEREEEERFVADALEQAATGGPAALGLEDCLWAGSVKAVERLLVQDGTMAPGIVCTNADWLGLAGESCPVCGAPTRATEDVVDELAEAVIDAGGSIEHVQAETPLREHGLAASLRFPLPPRPDGAGQGN